MSVSPPEVSRLDTSLLPEVRLEGSEGSESREELREEDRDSEQQAELEDWTGLSLSLGATLLVSSISSLGLELVHCNLVQGEQHSLVLVQHGLVQGPGKKGHCSLV